MVVNRKVTGRASTLPGGLALGAGASMVMTLVLSVVTAKLIDTGAMAESSVGYAAMVILLLSAGAGAVVSVGRIKRRKLLVCLVSGGIYYLLLLTVTAVFFGGQYTGMGVTALTVTGGSGAMGLLMLGQGRGRRKSRMLHRSPLR